MMNLNNRKWRKIALKESLYIFNNKEEMDNFSKIADTIPNTQNMLEFIFQYLQFILEFYKNKNLLKRIVVVLDDYYQTDDSNDFIFKISKCVGENRNKLFLCILGGHEFIYKKYYIFF